VVVDPVCGTALEPSQASGKLSYQGKDYWFCSYACKAEFQRQPEKYAAKQQPTAAR